MHSPDLSIIIPTRNRYVTALAGVKQALTCEGNFELIVRDCSDSDKLREALENLQDERIRYYYQQPPVSMTDNWEVAVSLAQGDYICFIGDDDGINPITPKIAGYLKELNIQALMSSFVSHTFYRWPNYPISKDASKLIVGHCLGNLRKEEITPDLIKPAIADKPLGYSKLPGLYNSGIVARDAIESLKKINGRVFRSSAPDAYFAYASTSVLKESYLVDYPLTIIGASKPSNAAQRTSPRLKGELNQHFGEYSNYKFHTLVPPLNSVLVMLNDAMLKAMEDTHRQDLIKWFNIERFYAQILGQRRSCWKIIIRHLHNEALGDKNIIYKLKIYGGVIFHIVIKTVNRKIIRPILSKLLPKKEKTVTYYAQDINEASVKLLQHLNDIGVTEKVIERLDFLVKKNREKTNSPQQEV